MSVSGSGRKGTLTREGHVSRLREVTTTTLVGERARAMRKPNPAAQVERRSAADMPDRVHVPLPRRYRRLLSAAIGAVAGAVLGLAYLYFMLRALKPGLFLGYAIFGAVCGVFLATIPGFIWAFIRKQVYHVFLRQWTDRAQVFAREARHELEEAEARSQADGPLVNSLAVARFLQRDYVLAIEGFKQAQAHGDADAPNNLPAALAETGAWAELASLLTGEPTMSPGEHVNLARIAAYVPDEAVVERLWALAQNTSEPILLNNLAVRAIHAERYAPAQQALELASTHRATYPYVHANLGVLAYRQGDLKQALTQMASAAGFVAEDDVIFSNLGALLGLTGDLRGAEKWLQRALQIQPRNAATLLNMANVQNALGQPDDAVATIKSVLSLHEYLPEAQYNLGLVYAGAGNLVQAAEYFQMSASNREDLDALNNLGCSLFRQGQYQAAYGYFKQVAELSSTGVHRRNLIRAELGAGRNEEAAKLLDELPNEDDLALERGLVHLLQALQMKGETETHRQLAEANLNQAMAAFTRAIARDQNSGEAALDNGLAQYLRGDYVAAGDTIIQALKKTTAHRKMAYLAGICFVRAGLHKRDLLGSSGNELPPLARELFLKARPILEKAAEVPQVAELSGHDLGLLNYLLGDYQRAIDAFRKIIRPDSPIHLLNALAVAEARQAQVLQLSTQTVSLMPEGRKREIRQQSRILLASAIHYFNTSLEQAPKAPLVHANLGLALMLRNQKGDVEAALYHWQLMHEHGDARARKTYEQFMQAQSPDAASRLRFQDTDLIFRPLQVADWIVHVPPEMSGPKWIVAELLDVPEWRLEAQDRLVHKALKYRAKAERVRRKLHRLAI